MRRLQKNKSTTQKQEYLSVSVMTLQHKKKKEKIHEYYRNIKKAEPERYKEIKKHKQTNFLESMATSVDHDRQNE